MESDHDEDVEDKVEEEEVEKEESGSRSVMGWIATDNLRIDILSRRSWII